MFEVTKTFGHDRGLSACFRQWRSTHSHCRFLHGYSLSVQLVFLAKDLDARNWVIDFGGFAKIKKFLEDTFDHKVVVAEDDPIKDELCALAGLDAADVVVLPAVGCERFAQFVHSYVDSWIRNELVISSRVILKQVTIAEHGANSATYYDRGALISFMKEVKAA